MLYLEPRHATWQIPWQCPTLPVFEERASPLYILCVVCTSNLLSFSFCLGCCLQLLYLSLWMRPVLSTATCLCVFLAWTAHMVTLTHPWPLTSSEALSPAVAKSAVPPAPRLCFDVTCIFLLPCYRPAFCSAVPEQEFWPSWSAGLIFSAGLQGYSCPLLPLILNFIRGGGRVEAGRLMHLCFVSSSSLFSYPSLCCICIRVYVFYYLSINQSL